MNYLIDTHVLLWWLFNDPRLTQDMRIIISNPANNIFVSGASAWEIATKYRLGKLMEAKELVENYHEILAKAGFIELSITSIHALRAGTLPIEHRDPFDRMLIAQAELESMYFISYDQPLWIAAVEIIPKKWCIKNQ